MKEKIENIVDRGIFQDLNKAERARQVFETIGKRHEQVNKLPYHQQFTFAYLQSLSFREYILSLARVYDYSKSNNETRCIRWIIDRLINHPEQFPKIAQPYQLGLHLQQYGYSDELANYAYSGNAKMFTELFGENADEEYESLEKERKLIKDWRDKIIAHNQYNPKVEKIVFDELIPLLNFGLKLLTIMGWAYLSTAYGIQNDFFPRKDAMSDGRKINKFLDELM